MLIKRPAIAMSAFAAITLAAIAAYAHEESAGSKLPTVWQGLDTNGDGQVTRQEMRSSAHTRFSRADENGDGTITRTEWMNSGWPNGWTAKATNSFAMMDVDQSGAIEPDEIRSPRQNAGVFGRLDRDQDDALTGEELRATRY